MDTERVYHSSKHSFLIVNAWSVSLLLLSCWSMMWSVFRCPHSENFDWQTLSGRMCNYYTYGAAVVKVELDCLTGNFTVAFFWIVADFYRPDIFLSSIRSTERRSEHW